MTIDVEEAHKHAFHNQSEILESSICGCFSCVSIFEPGDITEWTDRTDEREITALCPYCRTNAVIGSASGYTIDNEFLEEMNKHWFSTSYKFRHGLNGETWEKVLTNIPTPLYNESTIQEVNNMADQHQLDVLRQGWGVWNPWREQHPEIQPDLSDADLSFANLYRADLGRANLSGAGLINATLINANLSGANLSGANLSRADLSDATLSDADLSGANLSGADLSGADLSGANLSGADLSYANLSRARVGWTHFDAIDLRTVRGLETVEH